MLDLASSMLMDSATSSISICAEKNRENPKHLDCEDREELPRLTSCYVR